METIFNFMVCYTQLIYIKQGKEEIFHEYENKVLPLLSKYEGTLLLRIRPDEKSIIAASGDTPYEIHLVSFPGKTNFNNYLADESRKAALPLKDESVLRVLLIEGSAM
jgi:hypothetical protein